MDFQTLVNRWVPTWVGGGVDEPENFLGNAIGHRLHRGSTKSKVGWKWELGKGPEGPRRVERSLLGAVRKWFCFSLFGALKVVCSTKKNGVSPRYNPIKSHSPVMICGNSKACYQASAWQHRKSKNPIQTFDSWFWLLESAENGGVSTVHFVPVRFRAAPHKIIASWHRRCRVEDGGTILGLQGGKVPAGFYTNDILIHSCLNKHMDIYIYIDYIFLNYIYI